MAAQNELVTHCPIPVEPHLDSLCILRSTYATYMVPVHNFTTRADFSWNIKLIEALLRNHNLSIAHEGLGAKHNTFRCRPLCVESDFKSCIRHVKVIELGQGVMPTRWLSWTKHA